MGSQYSQQSEVQSVTNDTFFFSPIKILKLDVVFKLCARSRPFRRSLQAFSVGIYLTITYSSYRPRKWGLLPALSYRPNLFVEICFALTMSTVSTLCDDFFLRRWRRFKRVKPPTHFQKEACAMSILQMSSYLVVSLSNIWKTLIASLEVQYVNALLQLVSKHIPQLKAVRVVVPRLITLLIVSLESTRCTKTRRVC